MSGDIDIQRVVLNNFIDGNFHGRKDGWLYEQGENWKLVEIATPHLETVGCCCFEVEASNTKSMSIGASKAFELASYILNMRLFFDTNDIGSFPITKAETIGGRIIDSFRRLRIDNAGAVAGQNIYMNHESYKSSDVDVNPYRVNGLLSNTILEFNKNPVVDMPKYGKVDKGTAFLEHGMTKLMKLSEAFVSKVLNDGVDYQTMKVEAEPDADQHENGLKAVIFDDYPKSEPFALDFGYQGFVPYVDSIRGRGASRQLMVRAPFVRRAYR